VIRNSREEGVVIIECWYTSLTTVTGQFSRGKEHCPGFLALVVVQLASDKAIHDLHVQGL
jgi:hypothetical protein